MATFDLEKARKDGFSDEEIGQFLSKQSGFNYDKAREDGFSASDIVEKLSKSPVPPALVAAPPPMPTPKEAGLQGDLTPSSSSYKEAEFSPDVVRETGGKTRLFPEGAEKVPAALGAAGMVMAAPPVGIPAAVGLAALGGGAGEAVRQLVERASGGDAPKTSGEAAALIAARGGEQAALEVGGRAVIKAIGKILAPFKDSVVEGAVAAGKKLKEFGEDLMPSQITDSRTLDVMENMARGSFFGSGTMIKKEAAQSQALKEMGEDVSNKFTTELTKNMGDRDAGELFVNTVTGGRDAFKTAAEKLYRNVDDLVDEVVTPGGKLKSASTGQFKASIVPTTVLKNRANEVAAEYSRIADLGKSDVGSQLIEKIRSLPDNIGFGDAQLLRSNLLSLSRDLVNKGESRASAFVSDMIGKTNTIMEEAASQLPKGAFAAWQKANKFYKFGAKYFDNDFISKLATKGDVPWERVGEKIFATGNVEQVYQARRALRAAEFAQKTDKALSSVRYPKDIAALPPAKFAETVKASGKQADLTPAFSFDDAWKAMQSGFYENQVLAPSMKDGVIQGESLLKRLTNPKLSRTMEAAFTETQMNAIKDFATAAKLVQKRPEGGANMVMQLAQGGAIVNLVSAPFAALASGDAGAAVAGAMSGGSGAVFIAPQIMAKLLTSPKTAKWLTEGLKVPAGSEAAITLGARVIQAANNIHEASQRREFIKKRKAKGLPVKGEM